VRLDLDLAAFAWAAIAHYEASGERQRARVLLWWLFEHQRGLS
jgi:hypothetical protein